MCIQNGLWVYGQVVPETLGGLERQNLPPTQELLRIMRSIDYQWDLHVFSWLRHLKAGTSYSAMVTLEIS